MLKTREINILDESLNYIYIASLLLIGLNALAYEIAFPPYLFFLLSLALQLLAFFKTYKEWGIETTFIMLFCINWPGSWTNIGGSRTKVLQLPWFYIIGIFLGICFIVKILLKGELKKKLISLPIFWFAAVVIVLIILSFKTTSIAESLKDILPILFYWGLIALSAIQKGTLNRNQMNGIWSVYIVTNLIVSLMIFLQFTLYHLFDVEIFKVYLAGSWNGDIQTGFWFLMEDGSSATIMMGVAVIVTAIRANESRSCKLFYTGCMYVIATALSLSARRTGILACIVSLILYGFIELVQRKSPKELLYNHGLDALLCLWMLLVLNIVRPMFKLGNLIDNNGRMEGYETATELIKSVNFNALVGTGMNDADVAKEMWGGTIPHNFIVRWFLMGGVFFTLLGIMMIIYILVQGYRKKLFVEQIVYFNCILGGCAIPDIFNARFFAVICMIILLSSEYENKRSFQNPSKVEIQQ